MSRKTFLVFMFWCSEPVCAQRRHFSNPMFDDITQIVFCLSSQANGKKRKLVEMWFSCTAKQIGKHCVSQRDWQLAAKGYSGNVFFMFNLFSVIFSCFMYFAYVVCVAFPVWRFTNLAHVVCCCVSSMTCVLCLHSFFCYGAFSQAFC